MREHKYYEFTVTKRGSNEVLSKRIVNSNEDIRYLHELEWLYFKFEVAKLDVYARQKDYNIKSRKLSEKESKPYRRNWFGK